jgi:hypothetical protein
MKFVSSVAAWALLVAGCSATPGVSSAGGGTPTGGAGGGGGGAGGSTPAGPPPKPDFGFTAGTTPDGGAGAKNCGAKAFDLQRAPAQILIVLDKSGSMADPAPPAVGSKWINVTGALNETVAATNGTVLWGLKYFPQPLGCMVADGVDVPIAAMNSMPIAGSISTAAPNGSTPTALAVTKAVDYLKGLGTTTPKYIVLATDGLPNCRGGGPLGGAAMDPDGATMAVAAAAAAGFHTFVVGIATAGTDSDGTLSRMAVAGMEPRAMDPKYYPVTSRADLVAALGLITGQVTNCVFPLDQLPPAPTDVTVKINGMTVPRDATHMMGWDLTNNNTAVQVYGSYCDMLKANGAGEKIEIVYGCFIP